MAMRLCAALSLQARAGVNIEETTARPSGTSVLFALGLAALAAGCSSRPYGNLVVGAGAPDAGTVDMLVATTRAAVSGPPGVIFGGARGSGLDFANIVISIPPDSARTPGDVQWPSSPPGDPERSFVTLRVDRVDLVQARADFDARVARTSGRKVLVFVHGYNTRFEEAVYRFAQIVHDAHVDVAPVLFTWPSGGAAIDYIYDRDSAVYSRDALEAVLQALVKDPTVGSISILAHSMGNYIVVEALRQMAIRNRELSPKMGGGKDSCQIITHGRPSRLPLARALARPAFTRSTMTSRSNSANEPMTWKNSRPIGVVVSIAWVWLMKSTPRSRNSCNAAISAPSGRAKRSYFHTSTQSKRRRRASAISASNSGARRRFTHIPRCLVDIFAGDREAAVLGIEAQLA